MERKTDTSAAARFTNDEWNLVKLDNLFLIHFGNLLEVNWRKCWIWSKICFCVLHLFLYNVVEASAFTSCWNGFYTGFVLAMVLCIHALLPGIFPIKSIDISVRLILMGVRNQKGWLSWRKQSSIQSFLDKNPKAKEQNGTGSLSVQLWSWAGV